MLNSKIDVCCGPYEAKHGGDQYDTRLNEGITLVFSYSTFLVDEYNVNQVLGKEN